MSKKSKLREKILSGEPKNIDFTELCTFLQQAGFDLRQKGSHRTFPQGHSYGDYRYTTQARRKIEAISDSTGSRHRGEIPVMKATDYSVLIVWSKEDEAFLAQVLELAGCVADGATQEEALANATLAAKNWIDTAKEIGREIPEPAAFEQFEGPVDSEAELQRAVENELSKLIPELVKQIETKLSDQISHGLLWNARRFPSRRAGSEVVREKASG